MSEPRLACRPADPALRDRIPRVRTVPGAIAPATGGIRSWPRTGRVTVSSRGLPDELAAWAHTRARRIDC